MAKTESVIKLGLETIALKKQALVFVNSKRSAEKTAEEIAERINTSDMKDLSEKVLNELETPTRQCHRLAGCIEKGIAFHHAGLTSKQKELVEDNFREGKIKIICATPTLCLSKDTRIWNDIHETEVSKFKDSNSLFALSKNKLISMKPLKVQMIANSSKLIQISSVSNYSIKVTPNHKMLIKRKNKKMIICAENINKKDKIATIGKLNISNVIIPSIKDFILDNNINIENDKFNPELSYLIGVMLGDGYSGVETNNGKIRYKGSPCIVGMDNEIFLHAMGVCERFNLSSKKTNTFYGTPQLILGKNKWFREFLVRCGVEKGIKKHISEKLMRMDLENISWLLKGLFDTDGYVEKRVGPGFSNASERLVKQMQKLLLRFGIVARVRRREGGSMKIHEKEYKTLPSFELIINQKKSIFDFYRFIGFEVQRKQNDLIDLIARICSNINYVSCDKCNYKIYKDIFSGRTKEQKKWGQIKSNAINLLGKRGELGSRELKEILDYEPKKKDSRLNHHYELIQKRKIGSRSNTEWFWSFNSIGKWIFDNILNKNRRIDEFFRLRECPLCKSELEWVIKKGWRDSDFEGDIFWDMIKEIKEVECEKEVYDVVLPGIPQNDHMLVANGFIVHNSFGLDLPAFRAIIKDLKRYTPRGLQWIPVLEYLQQSGRAGRPKFDSYGESIAIAETKKDFEKIKEIYIDGEAEEIYSKLAVEPVLRAYVLSLIVSGFVSSEKEIFDFFEKTFWAHQYSDMGELEFKIKRVLGMLEEFGFISYDNELYAPTIIGTRVSQLYIDPLTANLFIEGIRGIEEFDNLSLLQLVSYAREMMPLLRTGKKDGFVEEAMAEYEEKMLVKVNAWELNYGDFIDSVKTGLFFLEWINEKDEEFLLEKYSIRPGEIKVKLDLCDWLLYSLEELARLSGDMNAAGAIIKLRMRIKYGAKEELLPLLKLKNIGRVRARKLFSNGIKNIGDLKRSNVEGLGMILGKNIAMDVKKQVGAERKEDEEQRKLA